MALISINNSTTIDVTVAVNGTVVATVPAGAGYYPISNSLPARPFTVEARSPSGRVLASLAIGPNDVVNDQNSRLDIEFLACGELDVRVGGAWGDKPRPVGPTPAPCD